MPPNLHLGVRSRLGLLAGPLVATWFELGKWPAEPEGPLAAGCWLLLLLLLPESSVRMRSLQSGIAAIRSVRGEVELLCVCLSGYDSV